MKLTCTRCNRRGRDRGSWNVDVKLGHIIGIICPKCQTPEENAEAVINEATLDYQGADAFGRLWARPKRARL